MAETGDTPDPAERRRRRRGVAWWWWAGGAGIILLIVGAFLFGGGGDDGEPSNGNGAIVATDDATSEADADPTETSDDGGAAGDDDAGSGDAAAGDRPSIEGVWEFIVDVTQTSGVCAGEESEAPSIGNVRIWSTGDNEYAIAGLGTTPDDEWTGHWDGDSFVFEGQREEDGGTTTAEFAVAFDDTGALAGEEDWSWSSANEGDCPDGKSTVEAFYYGPLE